MAGTKYFKAEVEREGEWWTLRIPELGNLSAQAKRLLDAEDGVRKAIAGRLLHSSSSWFPVPRTAPDRWPPRR